MAATADIVAFVLLLATATEAQRPAAATHIVKPGETLGLIAQVYNVDIYQLARANGIGNAHRIRSWQELRIPPGADQQGALPSARGSHIVRRGETLDSIAKTYGVDLRDLMALNTVYGYIYPGDELKLPVPGNATAPSPAPAPVGAESGGLHIVRPGETLGKIAEAYGVSLYELQAANNIRGWMIYAGQELKIPGGAIVTANDNPPTPEPSPLPAETSPALESSGMTHTVRFGDTLAKIAAAYGVSLHDLQALNGIWTWMIRVGQVLEIPAGGTTMEILDMPSEPASSTPAQNPAPAANPATHTVQRGETLFSIAKRYGVDLSALIRANGIADATKIHAGLVLRVSELDAFVPPAPSAASGAASSPAAQPQPSVDRQRYVVRPGEFLSQIGAKFGMSWRGDRRGQRSQQSRPLESRRRTPDPHRRRSGEIWSCSARIP